MWVHGTFTANDYLWAYIQYNGVDCYVVYSFITLDSVVLTETPTEVPLPRHRPIAPTATPTETPSLPQDLYADYAVVEAAGTTNDSVRLRSTPSTASIDTVLYTVDPGTAVWVYGTFTANDNVWAYISTTA